MKNSLILLLALFALSSCGAKTVQYSPSDSFESANLLKARKDITPLAVVKQPEAYGNTFVAWVGEIEKVDFSLSTPPAAARFLLKHRDVDFASYDMEADKFSNDERGEGYFQAAWPIEAYSDYEKLRRLRPGSQIIAYGYPREVLGGVVGLYPAVYMRPLASTEPIPAPVDPRENRFGGNY